MDGARSSSPVGPSRIRARSHFPPASMRCRHSFRAYPSGAWRALRWIAGTSLTRGGRQLGAPPLRGIKSDSSGLRSCWAQGCPVRRTRPGRVRRSCRQLPEPLQRSAGPRPGLRPANERCGEPLELAVRDHSRARLETATTRFAFDLDGRPSRGPHCGERQTLTLDSPMSTVRLTNTNPFGGRQCHRKGSW